MHTLPRHPFLAICEGLNGIPGFRRTVPGGVFYAYANVEETGIPSKELADFLLEEAGVACWNGGAFDAYGEGYIRFSYANSLENLLEAVSRIQEAVAARWEAVPARGQRDVGSCRIEGQGTLDEFDALGNGARADGDDFKP